MTQQLLSAKDLSVFFSNVAMMLKAGVQAEEAVVMLANDLEPSALRDTCNKVYLSLILGESISNAMSKSEAFPPAAIKITETGEITGQLDKSFESLGFYYEEQHHVFSQVQTYVGYPAALLCIMSVIIAFVVGAILPKFISVYDAFTGSLAASSYGAVEISITVGSIALVLTILLACICIICYLMSKTPKGQFTLAAVFGKFPATSRAVELLSLSRVSSILAAYTSAGVSSDVAVKKTIETLPKGGKMAHKLQCVYSMITDTENPKMLVEALSQLHMFSSSHTRLLQIGSHTAKLPESLDLISKQTADEAFSRFDRTLGVVEPVLAAFMTLAVGATLIAAMLPLIGIMSAIA